MGAAAGEVEEVGAPVQEEEVGTAASLGTSSTIYIASAPCKKKIIIHSSPSSFYIHLDEILK